MVLWVEMFVSGLSVHQFGPHQRIFYIHGPLWMNSVNTQVKTYIFQILKKLWINYD